MRRRRNQIREKERIKGIHINKTHDAIKKRKTEKIRSINKIFAL